MDADTIGQYLIRQLHAHGVRHVFGIPGDYSLLFIEALLKSPVQFVNTCDEQGAGFAADGYARVSGLGALCVTYAVGSLKVANAAAQAYAERAPVVFICGAPGLQERVRHPLLHHKVNQFDTQLQIFRHLTVASAALDDPGTAYAEIDRVLHAAMRHQRPVYLEVPRDLVNVVGDPTHAHRDEVETSDLDALTEAVQEVTAMLTAARQPVIVAGVELKRYGLHEALVRFADAVNIPIAVTMQGKSVVCDCSPLYLGLYAGAISAEETRRYVEESDCVLMLGTLLTDITMGMFTANLERGSMVVANAEGVTIRHHTYDVRMTHFLEALLHAAIPQKALGPMPPTAAYVPFMPEPDTPITVRRLFQGLSSAIQENTIVLADIGDALFGALHMPVQREDRFLCAPYYSNMGFAVPASLGVQMQNPALRPLVLVGDGAFQMTGMEISTAAKYGLSPIVVVLNNGGYATERFFLDGPFNDIHPWAFHRLPEVLGTGRGYHVQTETELTAALTDAHQHPDQFALLDVRLPQGDVSDGLRTLGERFGNSVRG